jgi:hypothetical protein
MDNQTNTRRRFLVAAISGSAALTGGFGLSLIRASSAWAQATPDQARDSAKTLGRMARLLYPHTDVSQDVYAEVVDGILSAAANDPQLKEMLHQAVTELDEAQRTAFFDLGEESQLELMTLLQERAFFSNIKFQVLGRFYSHPKVWHAIQYPGSSVEYGGYVDRGFNDIDWLPEEA